MNLLPIFVKNQLGGEVLKLGWLGSAECLGAIIGGFVLGIWGGFKKRIFTALAGLIMVGITLIGLSFTNEKMIIWGIVCIFLSGAGLAILNSATGALRQSLVPKQIQGRVYSIMISISMALSIPGLVIAGQIADITGMRLLYFLTGIITLLIVAVALMIPSVINIEKAPSEAPKPPFTKL
jgi:DHA3 family macrolide efflux protein-like MFS transporter